MTHDIPLSQMQSRSSASKGGIRQTSEALPADFDTQRTFHENEKKGLFKRSAGGKRKVKKIDSKPRRIGTDGEEIRQNWLGKLYTKVINFSVVTKYFIYITPVALPLAAPVVIFAVLDNNRRNETPPKGPHYFANLGVRVYLFWLWVEIVW
jgi:hypothetical protein